MPRRLLWIPAALILLAGCSTPAGPTVATAQDPARATAPATPTASVPAAETDYDKALRYTRCMTANGAVTADPVAGRPLVTYNTIHRTDSAADMAAKLELGAAAHAKCKQYLPTTWPIKEDPKEIARSRRYVECMRQRGIPEPVPDADGFVHQPTDTSWETGPAYDAAVSACRHLVDDPANDQPENQ